MSKLEQLANEKFAGNKEDAIRYLVESADKATLDAIIDDCNQKEADMFLKFIFKNVKGSKKVLTDEMKKERNLAYLNLTEEEVKNAPKNPYKASVAKSFLRLLIAEGGILAISLAATNFGLPPEAIGAIGTVITGLLASDTAQKLISYVKFKNLQKQINLEQKDIGGMHL